MRAMRSADTAATARLHRRHLRRGLFLHLGQRFVARWHRTFVDCPAGWGAVVVDGEDRVRGFAVVALDQRRYVAQAVASARPALCLTGALALVLRPRVLVHFLHTRAGRYWRRLRPSAHDSRTAAAPPAGTPRPAVAQDDAVGVVHAIVTDPSLRGRGYARELLAAAERACREAGTTRMALVTEDPVAAGDRSGGAAGFYDRLGWERSGTHVRDGRRVVEFHRRLETDAGRAADVAESSAPRPARRRAGGRPDHVTTAPGPR